MTVLRLLLIVQLRFYWHEEIIGVTENKEDDSGEIEQDTGYLNYPANPGYGTGAFRRRIRLTGMPGKVVAELEDCNHGFTVTLCHDDKKVVEISAEALRIPLTTCGGAVTAIQVLQGSDLQRGAKDLNLDANPQANCTHILDLAILAIDHAKRGDTVREYDVSVTDELGKDAVLEVYRNKCLIHRWQSNQFVITQPTELNGNTLYKGFAGWAGQLFGGDEQEAAFVLQKGYFVAQARRYDISKLTGEPATTHTAMLGACYSYSQPVINDAFRTKGTVRDFSDTPNLLLKFT